MLRRWRWIGHVLRMDHPSRWRHSSGCLTGSRRRRGKPRTTWRRTAEKERSTLGKVDAWVQLVGPSKDRCTGQNNMQLQNTNYWNYSLNYINDLDCKILNSILKFADDTNLVQSMVTTTGTHSSDLHRLMDWSNYYGKCHLTPAVLCT